MRPHCAPSSTNATPMGAGKVSLEQFKVGLKNVQSVGQLDIINGVMNKINLEDITTTRQSFDTCSL